MNHVWGWYVTICKIVFHVMTLVSFNEIICPKKEKTHTHIHTMRSHHRWSFFSSKILPTFWNVMIKWRNISIDCQITFLSWQERINVHLPQLQADSQNILTPEWNARALCLSMLTWEDEVNWYIKTLNNYLIEIQSLKKINL